MAPCHQHRVMTGIHQGEVAFLPAAMAEMLRTVALNKSSSVSKS